MMKQIPKLKTNRQDMFIIRWNLSFHRLCSIIRFCLLWFDRG